MFGSHRMNMFSSLINRVVTIYVTMELIAAPIPDFQTEDDMNFTDVIVKVSTHGDRPSRSVDLPRQLLVSLNISSDQITFDLTENEDINSNAPIYTEDSEGVMRIQNFAPLGNVKYYQDKKNGASFMIESNFSTSCMIAIILYKNEEYVMKQQHCLFDVGKDMKFKIAKVKRNTKLDGHPIQLDVDRKWFSTEKERTRPRHKRDSKDYKIEMFFIIDYSIYNYWFTQSQASTTEGKKTDAIHNIRQFYSFVVNGMDVRYKSIQSSYTISILFSGIYIADTASKSQFVESNKVTASSGTQVDSSVALDAVTAWVKKSTGIPEHDHAMMFTRYDFTSDGSSSTVGLAYLSAMCSDKSVSVVEDHFDFTVITAAAHELGHGLSAQHDGVGNTCNGSDFYIMAPFSGPVQNQNPWRFSSCSVVYFTTFINKLNEDSRNCMTVLSSSYNPGALKQYTLLPGEIYDADSQCRHIFGAGSSFCKNLYNKNFSTICTKLWCAKPEGGGLCGSAVPGDGIQCGNKKWCISGECKYDECAPPGEETCLYGDANGIVITVNNKEITCSFEDIKSDPSVCYLVKDKCCQQCRHFHTGIAGCEYGDKGKGCSVFNCPFNLLSTCCGTCYSGPTLTTPSQESTTTEYQNPCKTTLTTTLQTPSTNKQQTTTIRTTTSSSSSSFLFRLTITLIITISDDLSNDSLKGSVISKVQAALTSFYRNSGLIFISCNVRNIRKGSLNVDYEVLTAMNSQVVTNMTALSKDMVTGKSKVMYEGQEVTVSSVTLVDTSGNSLIIGNDTSACEFRKQVSACPSGHLCDYSSNGPVCREKTEENNLDKNQQYFIYFGICAVVLVTLLIVSIYCCRKKRRSTSKPANTSPLHGVTNYAMDDFNKPRRPHHHNQDKY